MCKISERLYEEHIKILITFWDTSEVPEMAETIPGPSYQFMAGLQVIT